MLQDVIGRGTLARNVLAQVCVRRIDIYVMVRALWSTASCWIILWGRRQSVAQQAGGRKGETNMKSSIHHLCV